MNGAASVGHLLRAAKQKGRNGLKGGQATEEIKLPERHQGERLRSADGPHRPGMRGLRGALLLQGIGLIGPLGAATAQTVPVAPTAPPPATGSTAPVDSVSQDNDEDQVVVTGKALGTVIGNIPPLDVLRARDLHATGAANLNDLLGAIAPEIGAAAGSTSSRPIVLLNGRRISSFRELRDLPVEAIERVDIMPEEVALKYGYRPDEKVVNVVLKSNFKSTTADLSGTAAKGKKGGAGDFTRLLLGPKQRTTLNAHVGGEDLLSAAQQSIIAQQYDVTGTGSTTFAVPPVMRIRAGATVSRELPGNAEATYNGEAEHDVGHSLSGLSELLPAELNRDTTLDALRLSGVVNGERKPWQWSITGNGDVQRESTSTRNEGMLFAPGSARSTHEDVGLDGTLNGPLFKLPAGNAAMTVRLGGAFENLHVDQSAAAAVSNTSHRGSSLAALSLDIPISERGSGFASLGTLALNGNVEFDQLTGFRSLTSLGLGANWSPAQRLSFIASWSRDEDAPSLSQIGAAVLQTPETPIFDFTNGNVARAEVTTGGRPGLRSESRDTLKIGGEWQPLEDPNLRLRAEYAHIRFEHPISNITVSPQLESAFPDQFVRDGDGNLISVDARPVNFASAQRDTLRVGLDFSKALRSRRPSRAQVAQVIEKARAAGLDLPQIPNASANAVPTTLAQQFSNTGRITFSLTDTITFLDRAIVQAGLPQLNYLEGAAVGQTGGQPVHQVQAQLGYFKNGIGGRLGLNWRSATKVVLPGMDTLHFSPLATFDLRLFANIGQDVGLVVRHPWLAGTSVRFETRDLFDSEPRVHNSAGMVPLGYTPAMLDPFGRTVMLSIRKQFLPISYYRDQLMHFEQDQLQQPH